MAVHHQQAVDQRGLKTLVIWLLWAITSGVVFFMLYREAGVLDFILSDNTHITQVILAMFLFGVLVNFFHVCMLTMEWFRIYRLEKQVKKRGLLELVIRRGRRLVDMVLLDVQHMIKTQATPNIDILMVTRFSNQYRISDFVQLMGNLLITIGLIGTVLGMTLTMSGLNSALSAVGEDQRLVMEGVEHAMAGMGVAFYTTLLGSILGGVLLRVFAWIAKSSVESLQDKLMHTLQVYAAAEWQLQEVRDMAIMQAHVQQLSERTELLQRAMQGSRQEMALFREELQALQQSLEAINSNDTMRELAVSHARYFRDLRQSRGLLSFLRPRSQDTPAE